MQDDHRAVPPAHKALVVRSADAYASQENYVQAVKLYTQALDMFIASPADSAQAFGEALGKNGAGLYYRRALCYFQTNKFHKALGDLDCAISRDPNNPQLYLFARFSQHTHEQSNPLTTLYPD